MNKKLKKLTEQDLHKIIKESVKKILMEGTTEEDIINKWDYIEQVLGSDTMLSELFQYLDSDTIRDFVENIQNIYDIEQDEEDFSD